MAKRWSRRVWHVPKGVSYAIENSQWATRFARKLGFWWIDKDCHVTKDGVMVFGHWGLIAKNGFVLPAWFVRKYGRRPRIRDVMWEDLALLRTKRFLWRGARKYKFSSVGSGMKLARLINMGLMLEQKGNPAFRTKEFWVAVDQQRAVIGLPRYKIVVATLPDMAGAGAVMKAAHEAGFHTMVIRAQDGVPRSWAPYMTWWRGKIKWLNK